MNFAEFVKHVNDAHGAAAMARTRPLLGKVFVITGRLDDGQGRNEALAVLRTWGAVTPATVDYATSALIATNEKRTAKRNAAVRYGVPIVTEAEFVHHWLMPALADALGLAVPVDDDAILDRIKPLSDLGA